MKRVRPSRTFLEVDEFHALLDAAGEIEADAPTNRKGLGRRAMVATLGAASKSPTPRQRPAFARSKSRSICATSSSHT
jgi:hypothetical protein